MTNSIFLPLEPTRFLSSGLPEHLSYKKTSIKWPTIVVKHGDNGVTVQDRTGRIVYINRKAAEICGIHNVKRFLVAKDQNIIERFELFDEFENPFSADKLPSRQVLNGKKFAEAVICFRPKNKENEQWSLVRSVPWISEDNRRYVINTFLDITTYKKRENERAIQLGVVSHDVKSLLTSVKAYEQLLERKLAKNNDMENILYVQKMDVQLNKLSQFITDLMDTSRIQARKLALHKEHFDVVQLITEMVEDFKVTYPDYAFILTTQSSIEIFADRNRIMQVFLNLLTNAVKYSPNGTKITITLKKNIDELLCSIRDQGIGINKTYHKRIFELYYQVEKNNSLKKGLGIGLYIVEGIIKTHGGSITVTSTEGKGTMFSFTLPFSEKYS